MLWCRRFAPALFGFGATARGLVCVRAEGWLPVGVRGVTASARSGYVGRPLGSLVEDTGRSDGTGSFRVLLVVAGEERADPFPIAVLVTPLQ